MSDTYGPGLHLDIPEREYHALPGLASTGIKNMLKSPAHYQHSLKHRTEKAVFDVGHAAHAKILGVGMGVVEYGPEHLTPSGNVSEKAATKEWAKDQRAEGLVPVAPDQVRAVDAMAEAVLNHPVARALFVGGNPEVSLLWDDADTGVRLRGRIDYLHDRERAVDLKTTRNADPREFARTAVNLGYAEQAVHYMNGLKATVAGPAAPWFTHVLVEKEPPYLVSVVELDDVFLFIAQARVRRAIDTYAACQAANNWPGYEGTHTITAPGWYGQTDDEEMSIA